jgi:AmmeMemoRadiSam system protein B/AmmeMemoRadiSam system protein A
MRRGVRVVLLLLVAVLVSVPLMFGAASAEVREPAVAGAFYPGTQKKLAVDIEGYLKQVEGDPLKGRLVGLVVPHAGYQYSAPVAAWAYKQLEGRHYDTVVLFGPSHRDRFRGVSIGDYAAYKTPLGEVPVDRELARRLIESSELIRFRPSAHRREHSLEVQVPFLHTALRDFRILPIVTGDFSLETFKEVVRLLAELTADRDVLWIASTDLSHYLPYDTACLVDKRTISGIMQMSPEEFYEAARKGQCDLCGKGSVVMLKLALAGGKGVRGELLKYANSGDTAGSKQAVVGYAAIAFLAADPSEEADAAASGNRQTPNGPLVGAAKLEYAPLDEDGCQALLELARSAIEQFVTEGRTPQVDPERYPLLKSKRGVFVTIYKNNRLRGCIGCHASDECLCRAVPLMAISSACRDRRFAPLSKDELKDISIEVSVYLSPLIPIDTVDGYEPGKHGIVMTLGGRSATFLPHVATEQGWNREQTLCALSRKAGLDSWAWKMDGVRFFVYKTQKFAEERGDE